MTNKPARNGEWLSLRRQDVKVVKCDECNHLMVNLDADQLLPGDLEILKRKQVRISNPETDREICIHCEFIDRPSFGQRLSDWMDDASNSLDDSDFFTGVGTFGGGISSGGFSGGFGGFGGGSFSGGGASRSF